MKLDILTKQKSYYVIGLLQQIIGGSMSWITMSIFVFSGLTFWNTGTMDNIRQLLPWLNLWVFALIIAGGMLCLMWLQHKFIQLSIMSYWRKMFYHEQNPAIDEIKKEQEEAKKRDKKILELLNELVKKSNKVS